MRSSVSQADTPQGIPMVEGDMEPEVARRHFCEPTLRGDVLGL